MPRKPIDITNDVPVLEPRTERHAALWILEIFAQSRKSPTGWKFQISNNEGEIAGVIDPKPTVKATLQVTFPYGRTYSLTREFDKWDYLRLHWATQGLHTTEDLIEDFSLKSPKPDISRRYAP